MFRYKSYLKALLIKEIAFLIFSIYIKIIFYGKWNIFFISALSWHLLRLFSNLFVCNSYLINTINNKMQDNRLYQSLSWEIICRRYRGQDYSESKVRWISTKKYRVLCVYWGLRSFSLLTAVSYFDNNCNTLVLIILQPLNRICNNIAYCRTRSLSVKLGT